MESRENNGDLKAMSLVQEFVKKFRSIDFTVHPSDIPGESAGKGSNMAWAARKLSEKYPLQIRKDVIITGIDGTFVELSQIHCRLRLKTRQLLWTSANTLVLQLTATCPPTTSP